MKRDEILKKFEWCLKYGYQQEICNVYRFTKKENGYKFSFDIRCLKLKLLFEYDDINKLLMFNGDYEYPYEIELDYEFPIENIENTDDILILEDKLINKFLSEFEIFFLKIKQRTKGIKDIKKKEVA